MRLFYLLVIGFLFLSTNRGEAQAVVLQRVSDLMPQLYSISGDAFLEELSNGDLQLRLSSDFSTPAGPDVRILLGNGLSLNGTEEIVNLTDIGHFSGALTVDVPSGIEIDDFDNILFFCVAFQQFWASGDWGNVESVGGPVCEESIVENASGPNFLNICPTDGIDDIVEFENSLGLDAGDDYVYLITDEDEILQEVVDEDDYNFDGSGTETQRVYGLHYEGDLDINIGSHRTDTTADDCFEHSDDDDFITIEKNACFFCEESVVFNENGPNLINICPSDGEEDFVDFENSLDISAGSEYAYLITDRDEILLEVVLNDFYDFEGSGSDELRVYGMHYDGNILPELGEHRTATEAEDCFEHSSDNEFIQIFKDACFDCLDSHTFVEDSTQVVNICPTDGLPDSIRLKNSIDTNLVTINYAYIVTDTNEIAQQIVIDTIINFEGSTLDIQRVYGIHYSGNLEPQIGLHRFATSASQCFVHSDSLDFLSVVKDQCIAPFVCENSSTSSGISAQVNICPSDGFNDIVVLSNSLNAVPGENYAYLITDNNQVLQQVVMSSFFNFEGSGNTNQRVYGIHYDGELFPVIGQSRLATSASGCFTHSDATHLTVLKEACIPVFECLPNSVTDANGNTSISICPSDGSADLISFSNSLNESVGTNYVYLLTDENQILQEVLFNASYNFEGSSNVTQRVYGLHYDGTLIPAIGQPRTATTASECFTHSAGSFLSVLKDGCIPTFNCQASFVTGNGGNNLSICPRDGQSDLISFTNSLNAPIGTNYVYLLTDENEILQQLITTTSFDFEGSSDATQRIYGLHFDGSVIAAVGQHRAATTATGCFEHSSASNFLSITKDACPPPFECINNSVSMDNGAGTVNICPEDGINDVVNFSNNLNEPVGLNYVYLLTDGNDILERIISTPNFNFEGSGLGSQRVFGMHFDGVLSPLIGANRLETSADGCFSHSSNFVSIVKDACIPAFDCLASDVRTGNGQVTIDLCPTDGNRDEIIFTNNIGETPGNNFAYLITDASENLQQVIFNDRFNFEGSGLAQQRVFGIHFDGTLNPVIGQSRFRTTATECHVHSNGFIVVNKNACIPVFDCMNSGTSTTNGVSTVNICPTDGIADRVTLSNDLSEPVGEHYAYLLTDLNETLIEVITSDSYDFEGSGSETLRVFGIHFDGELMPAIGQNRRSTTATECFVHSGNRFLSITKNACPPPPPPFDCQESFTATTDWEPIVDICSNDGAADVIELRNNLFIEPGDNYAFLITDREGILQDISFESFLDFEGSGPSEQRVYGIHFDGDLIPAMGQDRMETRATGCFAHSGGDLFLTITKTACVSTFECMESLTATTDWETSREICSDDGEEDIIELRNNLFIEPGDHYAFLITDREGILQEVSFDSFVDFEGTGASEQRVYGIHFDGELVPAIGQDRLETTATGCFTHSGDNLFLTISKTACVTTFECMESLTATEDWITAAEVCATDGAEDLIELRNNLFIEPGENYAYLITDSQENLLDVTLEGFYDFEGSGSAERRVYGIHYDGELNPVLGQNRKETTATGCFTHSGDNLFLTISKTPGCIEEFECKESLTATTAWVTEVNICAGDGDEDNIVLLNNISEPIGENYVFLLTDEFEILQEVIVDTVYNFENTGLEEQRIYGLSFSGELDARIGFGRKNTTATGCHIHSGDNLFIRINKSAACESSTNDNELSSKIQVYPNPSRGELNITTSLNVDQKLESVKLLSSNGSLVRELNPDVKQLYIEESGLYFIQFVTSESTEVKKIYID